MKHSEFIKYKCGIHTRLRVTIRKSGGYSRIYSAHLLMKEYNIKYFELAYEMANNINVREEINSVGLDRVVDITVKSISVKKNKFNDLLNFMRMSGAT